MHTLRIGRLHVPEKRKRIFFSIRDGLIVQSGLLACVTLRIVNGITRINEIYARMCISETVDNKKVYPFSG